MTIMIALSLQLLLYGTTWLVLGLVFGLRRQAGLWWAAAFTWLAAGVFTAEQSQWEQFGRSVLLINIAGVSGFYCLMRGLAHMGRYQLSRLDTTAPLGLLVALLILRLVAPDTVPLRLVLFSLAVSWSVTRSAWLLKRLLADTGFARLFVPLGVVPVLAILGLFAVRPLAVILDADGMTNYLLSTPSYFKDLFALTGFVSLMLFNLAMAVVVVGGLINHLRALSNTDALTKLPNRRWVLSAMTREHDLFRRSGRAFSVMVIDVDFFKRVNDTHGHAVGDEVLFGVAQTMKDCARTTDVVARFGGEEFLVVFPDTNEDQAYVFAERMRLAVMTGNHASVSPPLVVTISAGISTVSPHDTVIDEMIARADQALYQAKHCGRNQVIRSAQYQSAELIGDCL